MSYKSVDRTVNAMGLNNMQLLIYKMIFAVKHDSIMINANSVFFYGLFVNLN